MKASGQDQPAQFLLDVIGLLHQSEIPYAVVGAVGVSYYGIPRATTDGDAAVWLGGTGKSIRDVCDILTAKGFQVKLSRGDAEDPIQAVIVVEDVHENKADLLIGVRGMDPEASGRTVSSTLLESSIRILGAEDLVAMKLFAGGPQDLIDVRGILQVSGEKLDMDLLRKLAHRYGVDAARTLESLLIETL